MIDQRFDNYITGFEPDHDSTATINLTEYRANYLKYASSASSEQLAVFSEIYYDKGWQAYIDGSPVPHFRADYILRAMRIPAGKHTIEFKFHPKSYYASEKSIPCILIVVIVFSPGNRMERSAKIKTGE